MSTPKHHRIESSDPWGVLIALASLIIVATGVAIFVVCLLWRKYVKSRVMFENSFLHMSYQMSKTVSAGFNGGVTNMAAISMAPSSCSDDRPKEYEIQTLDMFVPQEDRDDLGELHIGLDTRNGIQSVHHVKEVKTRSITTGIDQVMNPSGE